MAQQNAEVTIRPAMEADQNTIKRMVREERLDPTSVNWPNFVIAEHNGETVGIGQVRPYPKCRELGSMVVKKDWRGKGVGGQLIKALLARETGVVYLECLSHNASYYARFGFEGIPWWRAPMPLKLKAGMGKLWGPIFRIRVVTMRRGREEE